MTDDLMPLSELEYLMPLSELEYRAGREGRQGGVELIASLDGKAVYAQDGFDRAVRIDPRILAVSHCVLVFVDAGSWAVKSTAKPPNVSVPEPSVSELIRGDLNIYPGGFTAVDAEYDERLGDVLRPDLADAFERIWQDAKNTDQESVTVSTMTANLARSFSKFAGFSLAVQASDVQAIIALLPKVQGNIKPMSEAQASREWSDWVATFSLDEKPNKAARFEWGKSRGLTRDRTIELHKKLSPDHWKMPGANRNPR